MASVKTSSRAVVFAGPSLPAQAYLASDDIARRPPARRGDVATAIDEGYRTIILLDGILIGDYPPSPREIAEGLQRGVHILGASSLGAIRAVELLSLGMNGVGWVFRQYRRGRISRDEELLVLFQRDTFEPITCALINIRFAVESMIKAGTVSVAKGHLFLNACTKVYFAQRTPASISRVAEECELNEDQRNELFEPRYDIKRRDALGAVRHFRRIIHKHKSRRLTSARSWKCQFQPSLNRLIQIGNIDRVGDSTGFDATLIPTSVAVRCGTPDPIWVYSGKGETQEAARIGAVMEAIERTHALWRLPDIFVGERHALPAKDDVWDIDRFTYSRSGAANRAWLRVARIMSRTGVWVPADIVFWGNRPASLPTSPFEVNTTNGLAAHPNKDEAVRTALLEVIERHFVSLVDIQNTLAPRLRLAQWAARLGLNAPTRVVDDVHGVYCITPSSVPERIKRILCRFGKIGPAVIRLLAIKNQLSFPLFAAAIVEEVNDKQFLAAAGYGLKANAEDACMAALLELAQSRATDLHGAREDCGVEEKARHEADCSESWLLSSKTPIISFDNAIEFQKGDCSSLKAICDALTKAGFDEPSMFEFKTGDQIFAIRAILPDAETWHNTGGHSTLGPTGALLLE